MTEYITTFLAGLCIEGTAVFWTHYTERGKAVISGALSSLQALAVVLGVGQSVRDWHYAPAFILGYGMGSYLAIKSKTWFGL